MNQGTVTDFVAWCKEGLASAGVVGEILIVDSGDDRTTERALAGDGHARRILAREIYAHLRDAGADLLETLVAYLDNSGSVEATARTLFVHPNTVRYRLRRIAEVSGYHPADARSAYVLRLSVTLGRLMAS